MCNAFGKVPKDYLRLDNTKALINYLRVNKGIEQIVHIVKGGRNLQGTWIHPEIVPELTRWLEKKPLLKFTRKEEAFYQQLQEFILGLNLNVIIETQYLVYNYKIDFYLLEYNLAVEYDEHYHNSQADRDQIRQSEIEAKLNCTFLRIEEGQEIKGLGQLASLLFSKPRS
jgi:very-short-patch-repair endonuclease